MVPSETTSFTADFSQIINGQRATSSDFGSVIDPTTEELVARVPVATRSDLDAAVQTATTAFPKWAALSYPERQQLLVRLADVVEQHSESFIGLLIREVQKNRPLAEIEIGSCVAWLRAMAEQSLSDEQILDTAERSVVTRYVPLGVCAAITPWNFPMSLMMWKVAPALLTGNCVIVKPSPFAPLGAMKFVELAQQVLPPGVLSVLNGDEQLGPWISAHPGIARISLTGSISAGKAVMRSAAANLKRLTLELGGNDAAIVLDDVDPAAIAPKLFWGTFFNSGQICVAMKRIYVHERVYDAVRDALVAYARTIKVGNCLDSGVGMGPVQNAQQFAKVLSLIDDCERNAYTFALGGRPEGGGKGYFIPITIVDNPPEQSKIVQEEQFGPIVPLLRWNDEADVIKRANATEYGLAASVWSRDFDRARRIATQLEAGTVWINESQQFHWDVPFGGVKQSGIGVEQSKHGIYSWTNVQTITLNKV